jgi:hypothetical protein
LLSQQPYDFTRLCRCVGRRAIGGPGLFELRTHVAPAAFIAGPTSQRPDRS